jgi:hypothetical protein
MPKRAAKKRERLEELPETGGEMVQYDETQGAPEGLATVEEAPDELAGIEVDQQLVRAADTFEEHIGGFAAVVSSLEEPSEDPSADLANIVGWGIGEKVVAGRYIGLPAVKVFVAEKLSPDEVSEEALVPEEIDGYSTDVEEVGDVNALRFTGRYRPAPGGSSVGHIRVTAGTLGCLVIRNNRHICILSNNHVLANSNAARLGDAIVQPGPVDGGRDPRDRVGILEFFTPIQFGGTTANYVDAAVAWTNLRLSSPAHHCYRITPRPMNATLGMPVRKCGRTTQSTLGMVTAVNVTLRVNYGGAGIALFRNQLQIRGVGSDFSQGGDSGSIVVTAVTRQPTALLFAGGGGFTFASPIAAVIDAMGIRQFYG